MSSGTMARLTVRSGFTTFETTVTRESEAADEWVRGVRACHPRGRPLVVGIDCKWNPAAAASRDRWPPIQKAFVLQLCVGTSCLVHQLFSSRGTPSSIESLLGDADVRFVGVGEDAAKLAHAVGLGCVDLAGFCYDNLGPIFRSMGLMEFARHKLYINMEKPISDWGKYDLDADQIKYACIDAYVAYKIGEVVFNDRESHLCQICRNSNTPARCLLHGHHDCAIMGHLRP